MNYYEHHIGDYVAATAHLSLLEDGVLSRLLRIYYKEELPLPVDIKAVQRLVCARQDDERAAVQVVLEEFFTLKDDGWHNDRCDEEINRFREKQRKARASANARWNGVKAAGLRTNSGVNADEVAAGCERIANEVLTRHQTPNSRLHKKNSRVAGEGETKDGWPQSEDANSAYGDRDGSASRSRSTDNFRGIDYVGTPIEKLPHELRIAAQQALGSD